MRKDEESSCAVRRLPPGGAIAQRDSAGRSARRATIERRGMGGSANHRVRWDRGDTTASHDQRPTQVVRPRRGWSRAYPRSTAGNATQAGIVSPGQNGNPKKGDPKREPQNGNPKKGYPKNGNSNRRTPNGTPKKGDPKNGNPNRRTPNGSLKRETLKLEPQNENLKRETPKMRTPIGRTQMGNSKRGTLNGIPKKGDPPPPQENPKRGPPNGDPKRGTPN